MRGSLWDAPCRGGALLRPFSRRNQHQRAEQSPAPTTSPRKKVTSIKILIAPSIDGSCSKATSCKPDTSVSGGAYQDARKVSLVWNDIQNIDACLNSEAERTKRVQALFSPPSVLWREKRWGRRRHEAAANLQQPLRRCAPAPLEGEPFPLRRGIIITTGRAGGLH